MSTERLWIEVNGKRYTLAEYYALGLDVPVHDHVRFPHRCPRCNRPAYVGLQTVEHERGECK